MLSLIRRDLLIAVRHSRWLLFLLVMLPPVLALAVFSGPATDTESTRAAVKSYGICCVAESSPPLFPELNQVRVESDQELEALLRSGKIRFGVQPLDDGLLILTQDQQVLNELSDRLRYEVVTAQGTQPVRWHSIQSSTASDLALSLWAMITIICLVPLFFAQILMSDELESGRFEELMATPAKPVTIILAKVISLGSVSLISSVLVLLSTVVSILCLVAGLIAQDVGKLAELTAAAATITATAAGDSTGFTVFQILLQMIWHSEIWNLFLIQLILAIEAAAFVVSMNLIVTRSSVVRKVLEKSFVLVLWLPAIASLLSPSTETWSDAAPIFGAYALISQITQGREVELWSFGLVNSLFVAVLIGMALITIRVRKDWPHP